MCCAKDPLPWQRQESSNRRADASDMFVHYIQHHAAFPCESGRGLCGKFLRLSAALVNACHSSRLRMRTAGPGGKAVEPAWTGYRDGDHAFFRLLCTSLHLVSQKMETASYRHWLEML